MRNTLHTASRDRLTEPNLLVFDAQDASRAQSGCQQRLFTRAPRKLPVVLDAQLHAADAASDGRLTLEVCLVLRCITTVSGRNDAFQLSSLRVTVTFCAPNLYVPGARPSATIASVTNTTPSGLARCAMRTDACEEHRCQS